MNWQYLDPRSMAMTLGLSTMLLAFAIRLTSHALGSRRLGLGLSSLGLGMAALGFIFIMLRGMLPFWVSSFLGNALILPGAGLVLAGTFQRLGQEIPWRKLVAIWLIGLWVGAWFGLVSPSTRLRVFIISGLLLIETVWMAKLAWREKRAAHRAGMRLVAVFGMVFAVLMLARMLSAAMGWPIETGEVNLLSALTVCIGGMSMILANLGLIYIVTGDLQTRLELSAGHDPLTQLLNRQGLRQWLEGLPPDAPIDIAMIDLDHLKVVNDRYSHSVGDRAIQRLADVMQSYCPELGQVARMGGEEFVLVAVYPLQTSKRRLRKPELMPHFIATTELIRLALDGQSESPHITLSAGLATGTAASFEACLREADAKLYEAKRLGRNQIAYNTETTAAPKQPSPLIA